MSIPDPRSANEPTFDSLWSAYSWLIRAIKEPEYIGENRCLLCTVLNVYIAIFLALLVASVSIVGGIVVFVFALIAIYLRGYLLPFTPAIRNRLEDGSVLAYSDHETAKNPSRGSQHAATLDPEVALRDAGAIVPCDMGEDLCLKTEFKRDLYTTITKLQGDANPSMLAPVLDVAPVELEFVEYEDAFAAFTEDQKVAQWESRAAFLADVAGARVLAEWYPKWEDMSTSDRNQVLGALRVFLTECPSCGGHVSLSREVMNSHCREIDVVTISCDSCGARLFEIDRDVLETVE